MSAANGNSIHSLVRFSDDWHRLAIQKMQQLQGEGMTCAKIVLERSDRGTAHIDRWGKVTWDDQPNAEHDPRAIASRGPCSCSTGGDQ